MPVDASSLADVAAFLASAFAPGPDDKFATLDYLRWQYLEWPEGIAPRAHNCVGDGRILAHAGTVHTQFLVPGKTPGKGPVVSNIHSWYSTPNVGPMGAILLLQSFATSSGQYAFSFSPAAARVFKSSGFATRQVLPIFRRVRRRAAWNQVYGTEPAGKRLAFRLQEAVLSLARALQPALRPLELEQTTAFDDRPERVACAAAQHCLVTERRASLLNHFLRYPFGETAGFYFLQAGKTIGFALLHFAKRHGLRQAKVLDCLLDTPNPRTYAQALAALEQQMERRQTDVVFAVAGTPWLQSAYRRAGYVRRGSNELLIRDPKSQLPSGYPVHMSLLDSDLAFVG